MDDRSKTGRSNQAAAEMQSTSPLRTSGQYGRWVALAEKEGIPFTAAKATTRSTKLVSWQIRGFSARIV